LKGYCQFFFCKNPFFYLKRLSLKIFIYFAGNISHIPAVRYVHDNLIIAETDKQNILCLIVINFHNSPYAKLLPPPLNGEFFRYSPCPLREGDGGLGRMRKVSSISYALSFAMRHEALHIQAFEIGCF